MKKQEVIYHLALSRINGIGSVKHKKLLALFDTAENVFKVRPGMLKRQSGLPPALAEAIINFNDWDSLEKEVMYCDKQGIRIITLDEDSYPTRLKNCVDCPQVLFLKGNASLNHPRMVSVIGTRMNTEYGRRICETLVEELKPYDVMIVSGLAFGIDIMAHRSCLKHEMPTLGVLAHGLDNLYPVSHKPAARDMQENGGLLTEYFSSTIADKANFPSRNRIVAGISDATIVVETGIKGGSMITAEIAFSYNRDVYCFPGRVGDDKSAGCNLLIKNLKAQLVTGAEDIARDQGWIQSPKTKAIQKQLFIDLNEDESAIIEVLKNKTPIHVDELMAISRLSSSQIASSMLNLEMQDVIRVLPGKMIGLNS